MRDVSEDGYSSLASALEASEFPECDLALRRGRHIDSGDTVLYSYLKEAHEQLETFYRRFGCDLIYKNDGYYYLLPTGDKLRKKHLGENAMLVGQALALLYLDPNTVQVGGVVDRDQLLAQLDGVVGTDALIRAFNPKRRRYDERVAQETVRRKVLAEVRRLASLGFVELLSDNNMRLRAALLRFAEPVRGLAAPAESLAKLVASGELVMREDLSLDEREGDEEEEEAFSAEVLPSEDLSEDGLAVDDSTESGSNEDGLTEDGLAEDGLTEDGLAEDGLAKDGLAVDGLAKDGLAEDGLAEDGLAEDGLAEDGLAKDGLAEDGLAVDGLTEDGLAEDGLADDGLADDGLAEDGLAEDGLAEDGLADDGLADDGLADDGLAEDGLADDGLADDGLADDGLADDGLADDGLAKDGLAVDGLTEDGLTEDGLAEDGLAEDGLAGHEGESDSSETVDDEDSKQQPLALENAPEVSDGELSDGVDSELGEEAEESEED